MSETSSKRHIKKLLCSVSVLLVTLGLVLAGPASASTPAPSATVTVSWGNPVAVSWGSYRDHHEAEA